jgi:hypothetical protein
MSRFGKNLQLSLTFNAHLTPWECNVSPFGSKDSGTIGVASFLVLLVGNGLASSLCKSHGTMVNIVLAKNVWRSSEKKK